MEAFGDRGVTVIHVQYGRQMKGCYTPLPLNTTYHFITAPIWFPDRVPSSISWLFRKIIYPFFFWLWICHIRRREAITHFLVREEFHSLFILATERIFHSVNLFYQETFYNEEWGFEGYVGQKGVMARLRKAKELFKCRLKYRLLRRCDHVFVVSNRMLKDMLDKGVERGRISVVPMGISVSDFSDMEVGEPQPRLGEFVIVYLGSLHTIRTPEVMIDAFEQAAAITPSLFFLVVGGKADELARIRSMRPCVNNTQRYRFIGQVPHRMVWSYLRSADVGLSAIPPHPLYLAGSSTKMIEMMACGLPVIANLEIDEQREVFEKTRALLPCSYTVNSLAGAMREAWIRRNEIGQLGTKAKAFAMTTRSYSPMADEMIAIMKKKVEYDQHS